MSEALAFIRFDTNDLPAEQRFPYFRHAMSVTFDVSLHETPESEFSVQAQIWRLGDILVNSRTVSASMRLVRSQERARLDGVDHYLLVLMHQGGWTGEAGGVPMIVPAGSVVVLDLACAMAAVASRNASVSYTIPRDRLEGLLPANCRRHGVVVEGAAGGLLADYLASLERRLPHITQDEAPYIARGTCDLIAACVAPTRKKLEQASAQVAASLRTEAKTIVDARLHEMDLSPEAVADAVGISRSALYDIFERDGGVAAFIRRRRLRAASRLLSHPTERRRISDLAFACGFKSEAHFSRAFRQEFGAPPTAMRAIAAAQTPSTPFENADLAERFHRWIREQDS